jgi:hypothetical protein
MAATPINTCDTTTAYETEPMTKNYTPAIETTTVTYKTLVVDGLNIAYREAGRAGNPKLVLLHGSPSSSHRYRNLIPALANRFHMPFELLRHIQKGIWNLSA